MTDERDPSIEALPVLEFAEPGRLRDRLVTLVRSGRKRATACLLSGCESAQPSLEVGRRWAVVDSDGRRVAVVETTELRVGTFADVEWQWIVDAGEGERGIEQWRENYLGYYESSTGERPSLTTPVVYERFRLIDTADPTTCP